MEKRNNPENTTLVYLIAFVVIFAMTIGGYAITQSVWVLLGIFTLGWISLVTIMSFQQRNDGVTESEEFMETFKTFSKKVPPISFFIKPEMVEPEELELAEDEEEEKEETQVK